VTVYTCLNPSNETKTEVLSTQNEEFAEKVAKLLDSAADSAHSSPGPCNNEYYGDMYSLPMIDKNLARISEALGIPLPSAGRLFGRPGAKGDLRAGNDCACWSAYVTSVKRVEPTVSIMERLERLELD